MPFRHDVLPGERLYREWRMNCGVPSANDIDDVVSSGSEADGYCSTVYNEYMLYPERTIFALIETKYYLVSQAELARTLDWTPNTELANMAGLPSFLTVYKPVESPGDVWEFNVYPLNDLARRVLPSSMAMTESQYRDFLWHLRRTRKRRARAKSESA